MMLELDRPGFIGGRMEPIVDRSKRVPLVQVPSHREKEQA